MAKKPIHTWASYVGQSRIKELRAATFASKNGGQMWLSKYLNDEQLSEVYFRIFERNENLEDVARYVRDVWRIQPDWKLRTFVKGLQSWKEQLATTLSEAQDVATTDAEKTDVQDAHKAIAQLNSEVDALKTLGRSIAMLENRMSLLYEYELDLNMRARQAAASNGNPLPPPVTFKGLTDLFPIINSLCGQYAAVAEKSGASYVKNDTFNIEVKMLADNVYANFVGDKGEVLAKSTMRLLESLHKGSQDMSVDPESGRFVPTHSLRKKKEKVLQCQE